MEITQERVNAFADATGDHQWIHVDVERAKQGPFGGPIAHGYLTLSLGPMLGAELYTVSGVSMGVNYGIDKLRFPAPVPVGSNLRLGAKVLEVTDIAGGAQIKLEYTFEVEGAAKPSCVAEVVFRMYIVAFRPHSAALSFGRVAWSGFAALSWKRRASKLALSPQARGLPPAPAPPTERYRQHASRTGRTERSGANE